MRRERLIRPTKTANSIYCRSLVGLISVAHQAPRIVNAIKYQYSPLSERSLQKRTARFNGVAHKRSEQLVGRIASLTVTRSIRRLSGSMVVSTAVPGSSRPDLYNAGWRGRTGLFHQPVQRLLEAGYRLTTSPRSINASSSSKPRSFSPSGRYDDIRRQ